MNHGTSTHETVSFGACPADAHGLGATVDLSLASPKALLEYRADSSRRVLALVEKIQLNEKLHCSMTFDRRPPAS